jgi:hypothetical protein
VDGISQRLPPLVRSLAKERKIIPQTIHLVGNAHHERWIVGRREQWLRTPTDDPFKKSIPAFLLRSTVSM